MRTLTLQIHHNQEGWLDAATLTSLAPGHYRLEYDVDYAAKYIGHRDRYALSLGYPVDLSIFEGPLPAFVADLIPQGQPLRRLLQRYGISDANDYFKILATVPLAPPGNIRVKEPWQEIEAKRANYSHPGFTRKDIIGRHLDFLDYMERSGAPIGGTTGAGGGSPKFMLREDRHGRLHAEGWLDDARTSRAYLVKLPYTDSENARMLARVERLYYDLLRELPLVTGEALTLEDNTLFVTRFDRVRAKDGTLHYHGLESLYSAHGISDYGARLRHEDNIRLIMRLSSRGVEDVIEYLSRDLLNRMLANTDNHGRNTSFIKQEGDVRLSPVYDVTAMQFFTGDFITELTRWDDEHQNMDRRLAWVANEIGVPYERLTASVSGLAKATQGLTERMRELGVPNDIVKRSREERDRLQAELEAIPLRSPRGRPRRAK